MYNTKNAYATACVRMFHFSLLHSSKAVHLLETREKPRSKAKMIAFPLYGFHTYIRLVNTFIFESNTHMMNKKKKKSFSWVTYLFRQREAMVKKWIWFDTAGSLIYFIFLLFSFLLVCGMCQCECLLCRLSYKSMPKILHLNICF